MFNFNFVGKSRQKCHWASYNNYVVIINPPLTMLINKSFPRFFIVF